MLMGMPIITHRTILWATPPPQSAEPTAGEPGDPDTARLPRCSNLDDVKVHQGKAQDPEEKENAGC
ncbi:hypothetical protein N7G274_005571 [Stereocaulon virgatum]|uniref:Uncharacterized protein n=1 Tax=Stereocaulon virgatum TaxID=373712 RepID=A0ABR4A795_9LECA